MIPTKTCKSEVNDVQYRGFIMLTREVRVASRPQATVVALAVSADGQSMAWGENDGTIMVVSSDKTPTSCSIEGSIRGLIIIDKLVIVADDAFGLTAVDLGCQTVWDCAIPAGLSLIEECGEFIAAVDNLGRLTTISYDGKVIKSDLEFTSVIKLLRFNLGVVIVQEDGSVFFFDGEDVVWKRPSRGEVGEAITAIGTTARNHLVIGREGYALVPGEEEALEIEVWDLSNSDLLIRQEIKNRLLCIDSNNSQTYLGLDSGAIHQIGLTNGAEYKLSEVIFDCKFPIKTIDVLDDVVLAGSWFYVHGVNLAGENWMVEHQGIIQYTAYCKSANIFYFAGDDQNDYTNPEPIGVIDLASQLIDMDKSELTSWFDLEPQPDVLSSEEIYSDDEKLASLIMDDEDNKKLVGKQEFASLLSALEEDSDTESHEVDESNDNSLDLLNELLDDVQTAAMPIANAGDDTVYHAEEDGSCIVLLDSSKTTGDRARVSSYSWIDEAGKEVSNLPKFRAKLNTGIYRFELRILDDEGNSTSDSVSIEVV
tara:strand:- start:3103 stop:4716 length:1614 start_codon:yes stop_codon:yes gene_type:complete